MAGDGSRTDAAPRRQIRQFVARILAPIDDAAYDADLTHGGDTAGRRDQIARRCQSFAEDGLAVLERAGLPASDETEGDQDDADVLYTVTALADARRPWTTDKAAERASQLLTDHAGDQKTQWIVDGILKRYLRPLFARSRPATVTEAGRKAAFADASAGFGGAKRDTANAESPQTKPWKYIDLRAVSVFAWAVREADVCSRPSARFGSALFASLF